MQGPYVRSCAAALPRSQAWLALCLHARRPLPRRALAERTARRRRLFALGRMVDVLRVNLARLPALWPVFQGHVEALLADPRPPVRAAAIEALGRALGCALATPGRPDAGPGPGPRLPVSRPAAVVADAAGGEGGAERGPAAGGPELADGPQHAAQENGAPGGGGLDGGPGAPDPRLNDAGTAAPGAAEAAAPGEGGGGGAGAGAVAGCTEEMLLEALGGLYAAACEPDVRLNLLRVLLQVLQRHGAAPAAASHAAQSRAGGRWAWACSHAPVSGRPRWYCLPCRRVTMCCLGSLWQSIQLRRPAWTAARRPVMDHCC